MSKIESNVDVAAAVGHIPSGLFIVCSKNDEHIDGYLGSWVQQVSFKPMLVSLAIRPGRPAYDLIQSKNIFTINVVGEHERGFLKHFWSGYDKDKNPFSEIDYQESENGGIIFNQAKSVIECRMVDKYVPGDHELIIAEVLNSYVLDDQAKPHVHIRKSGHDY